MRRKDYGKNSRNDMSLQECIENWTENGHYKDLSKDEMKIECQELDIFLTNMRDEVAKKTALNLAESVIFNKGLMLHIIELIEKRRLYFAIFHNKKLGELNECCLLAFWILKFRPIVRTQFVPDSVDINSLIAYYIVRSAAVKTSKDHIFKEDKTLKHQLLHAFQYQDITKEAVMAIGWSLSGGTNSDDGTFQSMKHTYGVNEVTC